MAGVVLVHGAWHGAWCWHGVVDDLERRGVAVDAVELPFTGFDHDVAAARAAIERAGPGSVVVAHSYGGLVVTEAAAGMTGLARLVYLAAFLGEGTASLADVDPALAAGLRLDGDGVGIDPEVARAVFYGQSDDAAAAAAVAQLRPLLMDREPGGSGTPAWRTTPTTYVVCTEDAALPPAAQRAMAAQATDVLEWPTDHSPFLTRPDAVADLVESYL